MTVFLISVALIVIGIAFGIGVCVGQSAAYRHVRQMNNRK